MPAPNPLSKHALRRITGIVGGFACLLCIISYHWLDSPIVLYLASHGAREWPWAMDTRLTANLLSKGPKFLFMPCYLYLGFRFSFRTLTAREEKLLIALNMIVIGYYAVCSDTIREMFGRAWPTTWIDNNPSFLSNGISGFHFGFHNHYVNSFPSGHALIAATLATFAWYYLAKWRWWFLTYAVFVMFIMVIQYYHFLSDVIAGATIGYLVALYVHCYLTTPLENPTSPRIPR